MKKVLFTLLTLVILSVAYGQTDKRFNGLDKEMSAILDATKAPGFAVAIVEGDKIVYSKGFGYSDYENKVAADANTLYAIGSCTKAFTSSILGLLQQKDKLSLDESPIKYIPELRFYNDEMNNNIIVKDLMCHRTGLPRHDFSWYLFPTNNKDSLLARVAYHEPFTGVRKQWFYNNFMFLAQGVIAERITEKSWEDNIREHFFTPLKMSRSNVSITELEKSTNAAIGYVLKKDSIISKTDYYHIAGMSPAGSINSSVNEMSNWLIAWINKGKFEGKEILPESYVNEAMSAQMVVRGALPDKEFPDMYSATYGYGWFISSYKGHYSVQHGGNIDGFSANAAVYPSDSLGIVVLTNQGGSPLPGLVRNTIADRMLKVKKTDWTKRFIDRKEKAKKDKKEGNISEKTQKVENTRPSHILQDYTGKYSHDGYGTFSIVNVNDSLFANFKLKQYYLRHVHYDVFEPLEVTETGIDTTINSPLRMNFSTNAMGEIADLKVKVEAALDHPITFKHEPNVVEVDEATMQSYVGEYELSGMVAKAYLKNKNKLYVYVPGQPEYELVPTGKHKFNFKTLEGFKIEFEEGEDKPISAMTIMQPNGTFKAIRK